MLRNFLHHIHIQYTQWAVCSQSIMQSHAHSEHASRCKVRVQKFFHFRMYKYRHFQKNLQLQCQWQYQYIDTNKEEMITLEVKNSLF
jgi:hypothetical protein